jgi:hypothetical protein
MPLRIKRDWRHGPGIALCDHVGRRRRVFLEMLRVPMRLVRGLVVIDLVEEDVIPIACQNHDVELAAPRLFDGRRAVLLDCRHERLDVRRYNVQIHCIDVGRG